MTPAEGQALTDSIRLQERIGQGAMGEVWRAHHARLGVEVAVKFLRLGEDAPEARARFEQEARAIARIGSPYAVQILDSGVSDGAPFIVMELLHGEDLRARLKRTGALPLEDCLTIVDQLCRALARAHDVGVVHRDIKPANLFLSDAADGIHLKVFDFGLAKFKGPGSLEMTSTGAVMGTPYYMSPEQFLDPKSVDHRADLWAAGVVAYACITGQLPFSGETVGALCLAVHEGVFQSPRELRPDLPEGFDRFAKKALSVRPEDRHQSATELAQAFREAASAPPVRRQPSVGEAEKRPWTGRGRALWLAGALALGTVTVAALRERRADVPGAVPPTRAAAEREKAAPASPPKSKAARPQVEVTRVDVRRVVPLALSEARRIHRDSELVHLILEEVDRTGHLTQNGGASFEFRSKSKQTCVSVVFAGPSPSTTSGACFSESRPLRAPVCAPLMILARARASLPSDVVTMTYMASREGRPQWTVSVGERVYVTPDDC